MADRIVDSNCLENSLRKGRDHSKLVCGCGYLGERVARRWIASGDEVWVTTRSATRAAELSQSGLRPIVVDVTHPFAFADDVPEFGTVLWAVGFDRSAGQSIHDVYVGGLGNLLRAMRTAADRFVLVSSTGVYGQSHGEWVDERSPCEPTRVGGVACLEVEALLARHPFGQQRIILRLAGIYGPQRLPKLDAVLAGDPIDSPPAGYLNLIHVEDAVEVVLAAERCTVPPELFVISDGQPVLRGEFYRELARLLHAAPPRFAIPPGGSTTAERAQGDKRICNQRMQVKLPVSLKYPSYREGLAAIVAQL